MSFNTKLQQWQSSIVFALSKLVLVVNILFMTGCDVLFIKKIELQRPNDLSQIKIYENDIKMLISTIDNFILETNMLCRTRQGFFRYCDKQPKTLVAFEDKSGFVVCIFMLGTNWEREEFMHLSELLENSFTTVLPGIKFKSSRPNELPECKLPE